MNLLDTFDFYTFDPIYKNIRVHINNTANNYLTPSARDIIWDSYCNLISREIDTNIKIKIYLKLRSYDFTG